MCIIIYVFLLKKQEWFFFQTLFLQTLFFFCFVKRRVHALQQIISIIIRFGLDQTNEIKRKLKEFWIKMLSTNSILRYTEHYFFR